MVIAIYGNSYICSHRTPDYSSFNHIWFLKNIWQVLSPLFAIGWLLPLAHPVRVVLLLFSFSFFPFLSNHYRCLQTDSLTMWAVIVSKCKIWMVRCKSKGITKLKPYSVGNHNNALSVTIAMLVQSKLGHSKDQPLLFKCIATYTYSYSSSK